MNKKQIEWNEIHSRFDAVNAALEKGFLPDADKNRILKARADILAREPKVTEATDSIEVVEFLLSNEHYGIESRFIREVYPLKNYTHLPGTPPFVLGIINVRGQIVSIVDIKKFFDIPEKGISDLNKVIIIHDDMMEFGILSDAILGVRNVAIREIEPPLPTLTGVRAEYLMGVTGEPLVILDAGRLLSDRNIVVHEEI